MSNQGPIAVVGIGCLFPGSTSAKDFWQNILHKKDLIAEVPEARWKSEDYYAPEVGVPEKAYCKRAGLLPKVKFNPVEFGIRPKTLQDIDSMQLLALLAAKATLQDAFQDDWNKLDPEKVGVILGVSGATAKALEGAHSHHRPIWRRAMREAGLNPDQIASIERRVLEYNTPTTEQSFPGSLPNVVAGRIANRLNFNGMNCTVDAACASSFAAIHLASAELNSGRADLMLSGGAQTIGSPLTMICFSQTPILSPTGVCRPFDDDCDGALISEGFGFFALKRLSDAERDNNKIYAVIKGIGSSSDGRNPGIYAPTEGGQARALRRVYERAGYEPQSVGLLEAHGTGTKAGDAVELKALQEVFTEGNHSRGPWCALGSVKSQIGHTGATAGAASLAKVILALHHKVLPPTINVSKPSSTIDWSKSPFYLNTSARPWVHPGKIPRRASVSSFGFGGTNFHLTLEEYIGPGIRPLRLDQNPSELLLFSGKTPDELLQSCQDRLSGWEEDAQTLARVAQDTWSQFATGDPYRLSLVVQDRGDLSAKLAQIRDALIRNPEEALVLPHGIYYYPKFQVKKLAFLFPGQGSQYINMGVDLANRFERVRETWDLVDRYSLDPHTRLSEVVFPIPVFSAEENERNKKRLTATQWAQPGLAATSAAMLALLEQLGLKADMVAGHSFGEETALYYAGVFDLKSYIRIARRRGELMAGASEQKGGMVALSGPVEEIKACLEKWKTQVVVANHNSPNQAVISGEASEIAEVQARFTQMGIKATTLNVGTAFHSPLVSGISDEFYEYLGNQKIQSPKLPLYSNTTTGLYPKDRGKIIELMAEHLGHPVRFLEMVQAMHRDGANLFIEVGPSAVLTKLTKECLEGQDHLAIALDHKGVDGVSNLIQALGQLAAAGVTLDLNILKTGEDLPEKLSEAQDKMCVEIDGTTYNRKYPPKEDLAERSHPQESLRMPKAVGFNEGEENPALSKAPEMGARINPTPLVAVKAQTEPVPMATPGAVEDLKKLFLEIIVEKTGYPLEILKPETHLEADLAIDSINRVEIFTTFAEREPSLPEVSVEVLAEIQTIGQVFDMISQTISSLAPSPVKAPPAPSLAKEPQRVTQVEQEPVAERVTSNTGGVSEALEKPKPTQIKQIEFEPQPSSCHRFTLQTVPFNSRTAVNLAPGQKVLIVRDDQDIAEAVAAELEMRGFRVEMVSKDSEIDSGEPYGGVLYLGGLRKLKGFNDGVKINKEAFRVAKAVSPAVTKAVSLGGGWFISVQDTGGDFGLSLADGVSALRGGLAGLVKTLAREWPGAYCKAIDIATGGRGASTIADDIIREIFSGGEVLEVGLNGKGERQTLELMKALLPKGGTPILNQDSVLVVSGGARGITAACVIEVARKFSPKIVLFGRSPIVEEEPKEYRDVADEAGLKKVLIGQAERQGKPIEPREINAQVRQILQSREIKATLKALKEAGSPVKYYAVDIMESRLMRTEGPTWLWKASSLVRTALNEVRQEWGPITGFIHGAGVIMDRLLQDKTMEQFDIVFDTKVRGFLDLLSIMEKDPLNLICIFSSIAARFGNMGQSDYAMANEVLNKIAQAESCRRGSDCVVKSINWGPWDGGMVSPLLRDRWRDKGILLSINKGTRAFSREIQTVSPDGPEVMICGFKDPKAFSTN